MTCISRREVVARHSTNIINHSLEIWAREQKCEWHSAISEHQELSCSETDKPGAVVLVRASSRI
jgi:hypothetical protein